MLSLDLALALRAAGLAWSPRSGDAFMVPGRDLDDHVFVLSDMVVEALHPPDGPPILAFNGTTEWALDSLEADEAVWLPREDQLRTLLGGSFTSLEQVPGPPEGYAVTTPSGRYVDTSADAAYARAVLARLG
ncbi:pilus assembly protein CpaE [Nocardioides anomalus]|uniref:Pilus assembly protein CpaE n=1 Tax=Nocardioides anomalus TaxID=2712223 RepID=A0A6G6W9E8_9ACTN|nr:pilus assembly protein CpaE [Nocardioides anomalus]QIG41829.1 pilus assembly protein CpaE [Nocardioides anomalus]